MAENHKQGTMEKRAITQVQPEEKQSTLSLTMIWVGGVISAPALMVGAILMGGLSLQMTLLITLLAFGVQVAIMSLNGIEASDTGYPLTVILGKTFGNTGSRYILAGLITLTQGLQAAVQIGVCGGAFDCCYGCNHERWRRNNRPDRAVRKTEHADYRRTRTASGNMDY